MPAKKPTLKTPKRLWCVMDDNGDVRCAESTHKEAGYQMSVRSGHFRIVEYVQVPRRRPRGGDQPGNS